MDFGCGGGIDVVLAADKVGPDGMVIGIDFSPQMIDRAKQSVSEKGLEDRVHLHVAGLEKSGLPGGFADVVISNCVVNLCPEKDAVYQEAFRILKPYGRMAISDIILAEDIEADLRQRFQSVWSGCLAGAVTQDDYWQTLGNAGFSELHTVVRHYLTPEELAAMACCPGEEFCPPSSQEDLALVEGKVASIKFTGTKPLLP